MTNIIHLGRRSFHCGLYAHITANICTIKLVGLRSHTYKRKNITTTIKILIWSAANLYSTVARPSDLYPHHSTSPGGLPRAVSLGRRTLLGDYTIRQKVMPGRSRLASLIAHLNPHGVKVHWAYIYCMLCESESWKGNCARRFATKSLAICVMWLCFAAHATWYFCGC